ncbi:MAG TPA: M48 family metallopeptidase [Candidatus Limnocylindria bacterium]|nr:M48 family metallopeptidase [Candidatus Limnocylindria bacterium]
MKRNSLNWALGLTAGGLMIAFTGCDTVPVTGRSQLNLVSSSEEQQMGFSEFDKMKKEVPISKDPQLNAMVQRVGKRIAAVAQPDMPNAQWEFVVFESPEANAFCLPGGKVGVYSGILPITKDDAGLATVIGHEVGHAVAHHGAARMTEAMGVQLGGQLLGAATAKSKYQALIPQVYGLGTQVGVVLPHSRAQESEADEIGVIYMARAGYPPQAAIDFWQRFSAYNSSKGGSGTPGFLSTHPVDSDRVAHLQQLLPRAQSEFKPAK